MRTRCTGQALTGFGMEGALGQDWGGSRESGKAAAGRDGGPTLTAARGWVLPTAGVNGGVGGYSSVIPKQYFSALLLRIVVQGWSL